MARKRANARVGHRLLCDCKLCDAVTYTIPADTIREDLLCKKRDYSTRIRQYAAMYALVAQERVDIQDRPMIWTQVAEIGDAVTNTAHSERIARMDD